MLNKRIAIDFMILATMNDVVLYLVGLQITKDFFWFEYLLDISTPETRSRLLLSIIFKNLVVLIFMILKSIYSQFNIDQREKDKAHT
jgi:hypothetical protein